MVGAPDLLLPILYAQNNDCVRLLFEHGARPDARGYKGITRLFCTQDAELIEILLKHGADPNAIQWAGKSRVPEL